MNLKLLKLFTMLRILFLFCLLFLTAQCVNKPYQPNYNTGSNHNSEMAKRDQMMQKRGESEIQRANKQRKKARKQGSAKRLDRRAKKFNKKVVK